MHLHTATQSPCAHCSPETIAKIYSEKNYNGIVCTNHYCRFICDNYYLKGSERANVEHYLDGYFKLKKECEKYNIDVFFGMELQPDCISYYIPHEQNAELLVYGANPEWILKEQYNIFDLSVKEVSDICRKNGWILSQSHPFRTSMPMTLQDPNLLDACEVFNGHPFQENNNELALEFGKKNDLLFTAGSDFHDENGGARSGVFLKNAVKTNEQLVAELKKREHTIIEV